MFTFNVDLGQIIIASLIGLVGWFSNRAVNRIEKTLDTHDQLITMLRIDLATLLAEHREKSK